MLKVLVRVISAVYLMFATEIFGPFLVRKLKWGYHAPPPLTFPVATPLLNQYYFLQKTVLSAIKLGLIPVTSKHLRNSYPGYTKVCVNSDISAKIRFIFAIPSIGKPFPLNNHVLYLFYFLLPQIVGEFLSYRNV